MNCTIIWNDLDLTGWEKRFARIRRSTVLQSYDYARAVAPIYGQRPRWGLIMIDGREAGLVQMMEAGMLGLHALTLDRGPLWFDGFGGIAHWRGFFDALNRAFPPRFGRRRRVIPELSASPAAEGILKQAGFIPAGMPYTTAWLDLDRSLDDLRSTLKKNWRNSLAKAERGPLSVDWAAPEAHLPWLVQASQTDRIMRNYPGPAPKIVAALGKTFAQKGNLLLGRARLDGRAVASVLILCHGMAATYQIGWSDSEGREEGGHYRLLWSAIEELQLKGIKDFDLGGLNDDSAFGVSAFKDGMGGERVTLAGFYR